MSVLNDISLRRNPELTLGQKILSINWGLVLVITLLACIGFAMLYSAANGNMDPWAKRQMVRFGLGMVLLLGVALTDIRLWFRLAIPIYFTALGLLVLVEVMGSVGMGAQRWIDLKFIQLQPSEVMKVALVMALARYFHGVTYEDIGRPHYLLVPLALVGAPVALVLKQPDLGTAGILLMVAGILFFCAGVRIWKFILVGAGAAGAIPVAWNMLHEYQRARIMTFLNPENDPLGTGYHILQSKIALGSGGLFGKGYMLGSQSHLNFLPEKQTDFIFTMLTLYLLIFIYGFAIALRSRNQFGRLIAIGVTANLFLYVFINVAMVMGLIPVVGVPLPLVSYGGTAMLAVMISLGLLISVSIHSDLRIPRRGPRDEM